VLQETTSRGLRGLVCPSRTRTLVPLVWESNPKLQGGLEPTQGGAGTLEEPGTLTQVAPVFPGSSRLGIEPKTPGWLVQDPTTRPIGDLIPTIRGSGAQRLVTRQGIEPLRENTVKRDLLYVERDLLSVKRDLS